MRGLAVALTSLPHPPVFASLNPHPTIHDCALTSLPCGANFPSLTHHPTTRDTTEASNLPQQEMVGAVVATGRLVGGVVAEVFVAVPTADDQHSGGHGGCGSSH